MDIDHILRNIREVESEILRTERAAMIAAAVLLGLLLLQVDHAYLGNFWFLPAALVVVALLRTALLRTRQAQWRAGLPIDAAPRSVGIGPTGIFYLILLVASSVAGYYGRILNDVLTADDNGDTSYSARFLR